MKIKTSFMVEENLWKSFKEEVSKRYHTNRKSIPPLSMIIEDLIRNYLSGVCDEKISLYEVASIIELTNPYNLLKIVKKRPTLAFKLFQAKPQSFMKEIIVDLAHKREDVFDVTWYEKKDDMIVEKVYLKDEPQLKNNPIDGFVWYIIGEDEGPPYFNGLILNDLFGEGYAQIILCYLRKSEPPTEFVPFNETITFSIRSQDNWNLMLSALKSILNELVIPVHTQVGDTTGYRIKRNTLTNIVEFKNSLGFFRDLAGWIPRNIEYIFSSQ